MIYLHQQAAYTRSQFEAAMAALWPDTNEYQVNLVTPQMELCFEPVTETLNSLIFDDVGGKT